jgi:tRNA A-37 threonylcarbamoyl transferase component Bud32/alpha-tubulin suppressor-like RCC1 family protein
MPSSNTRICPACAMVMPASFPAGLCPKCLLVGASTPAGAPPEDLEAAERTIPVAPPVSGSTPVRPTGVPSLELLRKLFPELEILDVLGAGGMGAVYKARQPRLNRLVALKIMVAAPGHEADFALRFEREAQVLARLSHPHIVIIYDFGDISPERTGADPLFYFLMEYVDGTDLGHLIKSGELKSPQSLVIVPQICEALQYAHDQGITHRDIKPANILIDKRGIVKIADFGLAKMITGTEEALMTGLTQTGTAMGTPHYMAPEQWEHPEQVDHRADIYALGVVFYEMLTGERPAGVFQPPSKKSKPPVDRKLDGVVMRAMDKNPDRRYQQAGQIADDVTRISGANKSKPASANGAPESKRGPLKPMLAVGVAAALAIGGWMLWQGREAGPPAAVPPKTALLGPSAPPATTLPKDEWVKVDWSGQKVWSGKTTRQVTQEEIAKDGGLRLVKDDLWIGSQMPRIGKMQNGGIRLRWKRLAEKTGNLDVHLRGGANAKVSLWGNAAAVFHGGPTAEFQLQSTPHGGQPPVGREVFMEIACVGRLLIVKRDGIVTGTQELPQAAPADYLRFQGSEVIVTQAELINLDALSEADALKLLGVDSSVPTIASANSRAAVPPASVPPPSTAKPAFPTGQWTQVLSTQAGVDAMVGLKGKVTLKPDGWLDFSVPKDAPGLALTPFHAANAGVRVKLRIADKAPLPTVAVLTLRNTTTPPPRRDGYRLMIGGGGTANPNVSLAHYDGLKSEANTFNQKLLPGALQAAGDEMILEFYTIGNRLIGRLNGELLPIAEDQRLTRGVITLQTGHLLRDIEVINLDGLSEAEALKLAGLDSVVPTKKVLGGPSALPSLIGRLRGSGFHLDGKPLDLKNAEGITDFVQVILTDRGWVGLRANGEQVSPDDVWSSKNQARLLPGPSNTFAIIDREGRLKIGRMNNGGVSAIPEDVQRIGVVDACWEDGQAIALLKDGSVRVWGEHYTSDYEGPKWPAPPAEALRDVRKIALMRNRAATLRRDGKWFVWGGQEGNSGPFDLEPFQKWGEIADIATAKDAFRVLTRSGQVYNLGGSRPLSGGLVAEGIEAISDQMLLPKGSPVWTWNSSKSRASAQAEVDALLQQIGNRPSGAFDLRVVGEHDASNVAAVWIEPVETGGAAAAPATVPSKPGRLEGTGTMATGRTLELVKFDAYGDFVDVAGGADLILALRANGETVSSDGKADFKGIRKIARSYAAYHCFIDMAGSLRFHPSREMTLPSSLKGRVVVDAACGSHHGMALLEGGQAVVFGKRYEEAMEDANQAQGLGTPRWPQPEAAALQRVKGVAVTYTHAATLHEDGTVSVWGWEGPVKWQPEAKMKPVRQISSHHDSLHLLDEAGQVWSFPMPRSAHPEQPVGFNGTVKPLGTAAVRLRDHLWLGTDGAWHGVTADHPVQELLERTDLQPETTFALLSSTANAIPYGYVLWIEPVVPGGAVSTSTSPPVSPSSAATPLPFTDREAAEWVLGLGDDACNVKVLKGGRVIEVRKLADLPAEPWVIQELRVNLSHKQQPELWGKVTDAQVMRLAGLKSLKLVEIRGNVTGASLKVMAHHPGLERLDFEGLNLRADDLRHLRASPLQTLEIPLLQVTDPESLAVLTTMPNLLTLQFDGSLDPALAAALPNLPKLEILRANTSANTTDEVLPLLAERLPQLSVLQHWGAKNLKGSTLGSLMALKSLTTLGLTDTSVNDEGLAQIAGMPQLLTLDLGQTRITDACLPTLKSFPKLESLQIYQTELTDAALLELAAIPTLKRLGTKASGYSDWKPGVTFTEAGIAAFQKLRPDVEVVK